MELGMFSSLSSPDMITPSFNLPPRWSSIYPVLCIASDCHLGSLFLPKTVVISSFHPATWGCFCSNHRQRCWRLFLFSGWDGERLVSLVLFYHLSCRVCSIYHHTYIILCDPHPLIWFIIISGFHSPIVRMQIHTYSHTEDIFIYSLLACSFCLWACVVTRQGPHIVYSDWHRNSDTGISRLIILAKVVL